MERASSRPAPGRGRAPEDEGDSGVGRHADGRRRGDRYDPGPEDPSRDAPPDGGEPLRRPDPHDGAGDHMGGAHRDARDRWAYQGDSASRFAGETLPGPERGAPLGHLPDDPPSSKKRAEGD